MSQKLTLVLMAGLPAAGKSKLARALRKDLQWYLIDKDKYRIEFLRRGFDAERASYNAYEKAFNKLRRVLTERKSSVILDCVGLHDFIINNVVDIVHSAENVELKIILCVVNPGVRKDRKSKRPPQSVVLDEDLDHDYDYFKIYELPEDYTHILHTDKQIGEYFENRSEEESLAEAKEYLEAKNPTVKESPAETKEYQDAEQYVHS
jgi:predicted kinase